MKHKIKTKSLSIKRKARLRWPSFWTNVRRVKTQKCLSKASRRKKEKFRLNNKKNPLILTHYLAKVKFQAKEITFNLSSRQTIHFSNPAQSTCKSRRISQIKMSLLSIKSRTEWFLKIPTMCNIRQVRTFINRTLRMYAPEQ